MTKHRSLKKESSFKPEEKQLTHEEILEIAEQREKENEKESKQG